MPRQSRLSIVCGTILLLALLLLMLRWFFPASPANHAAFKGKIALRADLPPDTKMTVNLGEINVASALLAYSELTGRTLLPRTLSLPDRVDEFCGGRLSRWHLIKPRTRPDSGVVCHRDGRFSADEVMERLEALFKTNGIQLAAVGRKYFRAVKLEAQEKDGNLPAAAEKALLVRPVRIRTHRAGQ